MFLPFLTLALLMGYAYLNGMQEAYGDSDPQIRDNQFRYRMPLVGMADKHVIWTVERMATFAIATVPVLYTLGWLDVLALAVSFVLCFSLVHNAAYYHTRGKIDVPYYNWRSQSTTTTAKLSFGFNARLSLFAAGLAVLAAYCLFVRG